MRVGFFTPLPPERSGIADYSYELLEELSRRCDVTAVVSDELAGLVRAPEGVAVAGASDVPIGTFDCNVYQMGNNAKFHRFVYRRALSEPGLLVMHDPSLADFHSEICNGSSGVVFRQEVAYDRPDLSMNAPLPTVDVGDGRRDLDRLEVLMARRVVEASKKTLLNSSAMADLYLDRYRASTVAPIRLPGRVVERPIVKVGDPIVFGVFGGINYYKRVLPALEAFRRAHETCPHTELVFAGRADDRRVESELYARIALYGLEGAVSIETDLTLSELEAQMARCDVAIQLRWPTAGEMSATLMRTFGAGRPAVVSDVPQFADLDPAYCWRIPIGGEAEVDALAEIMVGVARDPGSARAAGDGGQRFVTDEANYAMVADAYLRHIETAALIPPVRSEPWHFTASPAAWAVNLIVPPSLSASAGSMSKLLVEALSDAGISTWDGEGSVVGNVHSALRGGPHEIDLYLIGDQVSDDLEARLADSVSRGRSTIGFISPSSLSVDRQLGSAIAKLDSVWSPTWAGIEIARLYGASDVARVPLWPSIAPSDRVASSSQLVILMVNDDRASTAAEAAQRAMVSVRTARARATTDLSLSLVIACRGISTQSLWQIKDTVEPSVSVVSFDNDYELYRLVEACDVVLATAPEPLGLAALVASQIGRTVVTCEGPGMLDFGRWPGAIVVQSRQRPSSSFDSDVVELLGSSSLDVREPDLMGVASVLSRIAAGRLAAPSPWIPDAASRRATIRASIARVADALAARLYRGESRTLQSLQ
jgi:glycosyltransferase involved in cell wall biosynthesis